jgi:hypothetical protein
MLRQRRVLRRGIVIALLGAALAASFATSAFAHSGEFAKFNDCPSTTSGVNKCVYSVTTGGSIVLGKKTTPIVNPVTLQGGFSKENNITTISTFFGAANGGATLSKTPQPVPGGLAGLVSCPEISNLIERAACELTFENGLTGVNATLELARPATEIELSEFDLVYEESLALKLPVMVHLENPLLGGSCYVGSSSSPVIWNLTTGPTSPPAPYTSMHGFSGYGSLKENGEIAQLTEAVLVDNTWAAPEATGCGGVFSAIIDPLIDLTVGLPASAGVNSASLTNTIDVATAVSVNNH